MHRPPAFFLPYYAFAFVCVLILIPSAAHALPADFTASLVTAGLNQPTDIAFAPDGRVFIAEKGGKIRLFKNNQLVSAAVVTLPESSSGERGLLSLTLDPSFPSNPYLYVLRTPPSERQRISRFTVSGDSIDPASELILLENPQGASGYHTAGAVRFGPDRKLYGTFGSNGQNERAPDLRYFEGKLVRINADGSVPADNPYVGTGGSVLPSVYAAGFRNPWRFNFDNRGRGIIADVGQNTAEKVVVATPRANYGWPTVEADCRSTCGNVTPPLFTISHNGQGHSIVGGDSYDDPRLPTQYRNQYFFGDYVQGYIRYAALDAAGNVTGLHNFATGLGAMSALEYAPDTCLYYLTIFPGELHKICYAPGIAPLSADASSDVTYGPLPLTVQFSAEGSTPESEPGVTYSWNFGDGSTGSGFTASHVYTGTGVNSVTLSVRRDSETATANLTVWAGHLPPEVTINEPLEGARYAAGNVLPFSAMATDSNGNALPESAYTWAIYPHHGTHVHGATEEVGTQSGSFTVPVDNHEAAADTWYEFLLIVTDASGLSTRKIVLVYPRTVDIHWRTDPSGLQLIIDDQPATSPVDTQGVVGFHRKMSVPSPQILGGVSYDFAGWSDGGAQEHMVSTPAEETTYTARFTPSPDPCAAAAGAFTGCYYNDRTFTNRVLVRNDPTITFDWSGNAPHASLPQDNFSIRWQGNFTFDEGSYLFTTTADDGVRVSIDGNVIIDKFIDQAATTYSAPVSLTAGTHLVRMDYYERGGNALARLAWTAQAPPPPPVTCGDPGAGAFTSCYFDNRDFTGLALTRSDAVLNFNWGGGSPDPSIGSDTFSLRTAGDFAFDEGTYDFTATADDGVRVYVDDVLIIDKFVDQPPTTYKISRAMTAGTHRIRVEYYENSGGALLSVFWVKKDAPPPPPPPPAGCDPSTDAFTGCYYNDRTFTNRVLVRNDSAITFDWSGNAPHASLPQDNFSVRWQGNFTFNEGSYLFTTTADDGVRVSIDGNVIIDKFIDQAATTYSAPVSLTAGTHLVRMDYYERGGNALARLAWTAQAPPPSCGETGSEAFTSCYYTGMDFEALTLTRTDTALDFDWGGGKPDPTLPQDRFSLRSAGDFMFDAAEYEFTVTADDGVRVSIDGEVIIDKFLDQPATTYTASPVLIAGTHRIAVEYYENSGNALLKLRWKKK